MRAPRDALVVDDDDDLRQSIAMALCDQGWEVREARHGAEALAALERFSPSVMVLDWRMPVMDGQAVLEQLAGQARPRIVLVTATPDIAALAARHGVKFHLKKPFGLDDLSQLLERAIGGA